MSMKIWANECSLWPARERCWSRWPPAARTRRRQDPAQLPELGQRADVQAVHRRVREGKPGHQDRLQLRAADQRVHLHAADPPRRQPGPGRVHHHLRESRRPHRQRLRQGPDRRVVHEEHLPGQQGLRRPRRQDLRHVDHLVGLRHRYNKDLLKQVGYDEPPANWDDFLKLCKKLKNAGIEPFLEPNADEPSRFIDASRDPSSRRRASTRPRCPRRTTRRRAPTSSRPSRNTSACTMRVA